MLIWQLHMLFFIISSSNGIHYCPTATPLGMCLLCGPKSTHSSSPEDNNSLIAGVKCVVVILLGCAAKLHPSEGSHGAFILATIARDTKGDLHQLGSAQLGSSVALFKYLVYSAARQLTNC